MINTRIPSKVVIFYDIQNDEFLIRIIDKDWMDILKYDTLPVLCKMSDLFVRVIDVENYEIVNLNNDNKYIKINETYVFNTRADTIITDINFITSLNPSSDIKQNLKYVFEIPFFADRKI